MVTMLDTHLTFDADMSTRIFRQQFARSDQESGVLEHVLHVISTYSDATLCFGEADAAEPT